MSKKMKGDLGGEKQNEKLHYIYNEHTHFLLMNSMHGIYNMCERA